MFRHKSFGLLTGMVVAPRLAYRLYNRAGYNVVEIHGTSVFETVASKLTHYGLYGFMMVMPASGIAMGYYGGKGLPFFVTTFSSPVPANAEQKKSNGWIAKNVSSTRCFAGSMIISFANL
jgi:cytochrome b561